MLSVPNKDEGEEVKKIRTFCGHHIWKPPDGDVWFNMIRVLDLIRHRELAQIQGGQHGSGKTLVHTKSPSEPRTLTRAKSPSLVPVRVRGRPARPPPAAGRVREILGGERDGRRDSTLLQTQLARFRLQLLVVIMCQKVIIID